MSKEIEAKVLIALLEDRYLLSRVMSDGFSPDVFKDNNFRIIFKTVHDMIQVPGEVIDWITIENTLKRREWLTPEVAQAIAKLRTDEVPEADQLMAYVEILKDRSLRDKMMKLSQVMGDYCMHKGQYKDQDFVDFSSRTIQTLIELQKQKVKKRISPLKETIREIRDMTDRSKGDGNKLLGFSISPFERLEHILSGVRKGFY